MDKLDLRVFPAGPLQANNYLIFNQQSKRGLIIDLSEPSGPLFDFLAQERIKVDIVLLTHAHFDHIQGLAEVDLSFYVHSQDLDLISDSGKNGSSLFAEPFEIKKKPKLYGEKLNFDDSEITVIHTPGHTPGSVCLKLDKWLFSGDTLFYNSVGRTDIPLASKEDLMKSIREKILVLADDTIIYPGHGPSSTLAAEKKSNPFLVI